MDYDAFLIVQMMSNLIENSLFDLVRIELFYTTKKASIGLIYEEFIRLAAPLKAYLVCNES